MSLNETAHDPCNHDAKNDQSDKSFHEGERSKPRGPARMAGIYLNRHAAVLAIHLPRETAAWQDIVPLTRLRGRRSPEAEIAPRRKLEKDFNGLKRGMGLINNYSTRSLPENVRNHACVENPCLVPG